MPYSLVGTDRFNARLKSLLFALAFAFIKNGYYNFSLDILELCKPDDAISREQYFLDLLKPTYNILEIAGSSFGRVATDETLCKISAAMKGIGKGIPKSEETKAKMSAPKSEEHKAKISASMMGKNSGKNQPNAKKIEVTDVTTNITTSYISIHEAAAALNIRIQAISNYINRNQKTPYKGKYIFKNK